jgi:hypothetical protein
LFADDPEGIKGIYNPERGFRLEVAINVSNGALMRDSSGFPDVTAYLERKMGKYKEENISLIQTSFCLTGAIGREITEDEFNIMGSFFSALREKGLKTILRFAYEKDSVEIKNSPSQQDTITHTQQLKKILRENKDVILLIQAGVTEAWGEGHYSLYELEKSEETMKTFLEQMQMPSVKYWKKTPVTEKFLKEHKMPYAPNYFRKKDGSKAARTVFDYLRDHLGYRLELSKFKTKKQWDTRKTNRIELSVVNRGFSTLVNDHPVYFVLIDASGHIAYRIRTRTDPQLWQPYRPNDKLKLPLTHTVKVDITMEAGSVDKGAYRIGLWIPDGSEQLMFDYRYAIRCANHDVEWWVSPDKKYGVNILTTISF